MPKIQIQWDSAMGTNYDDSVAALREYRPAPKMTATIRLKGHIPEVIMGELIDMAVEHGIDVGVTLTATWVEGEEQLRLFGPGLPKQDPVADIPALAGTTATA